MVQSVELLLDHDADAWVRSQWDTLAAAGLPSQSRHTGSTNRPHITLAVAPALDDEPGSPLAAALTAAVADLPVSATLGGVVVFGGTRCVLARLVVPSAALLAVHARVAAVLADAGVPAAGHLAPDDWTAHVTLARQCRPEQVGLALPLVGGFGSVPATAVAARRWDGDRRVAWALDGRVAPPS
ncbi:2'-5' RNA ligase family protein [Nakamurella leprariae]|uniref:2'-5' RNA ligase family protein n=1 Tax=Nakamurella leprariae TaxID=2803911 RepID=A0A939BZB0_9ACTN|nr:2'-5' RNA ligase family protein [Nakamurella leprariae]MBM9467950.1 2'-5' RNA ligase family protein [Nakamurella leprariae]